jgi:hypothetical protein
VADKRRFELFADLAQAEFPSARAFFDVAGGQGKLNEVLSSRGLQCLTFDLRHKHLPVAYAQRELKLTEPCDCDVLLGLHPDGATKAIVAYGAHHRRPFAVVPCCSDNSMPYNPWMRDVAVYAQSLGFTVEERLLPMAGRARVIIGRLSM